MQREFDPAVQELMDRPQPVTTELEEDLANLCKLNRLFGSHRLVRKFLNRWLRPQRMYRVADLATGAGDIPRMMVDWCRARDISVAVDAVDFQSATLQVARQWSEGYKEINFICDDVLTYSPTEKYDVVHCSLALHHFTNEDAVTLLRHCLALSRGVVLVADLERSRTLQAAVHLLTSVWMRQPMTRNDARLSVRRSFSMQELAELAREAGWADFHQGRFPFGRQAIWIDRVPQVDTPE